MANLGCAFAEYIFLKFTSGKEVVSDNVIVNRVPPAMGDTEPNSIVVTLSGENHHETNSYFTYMTEQGSSTADEVSQRPPNLLPASPHAFSLARKWAHECLQNHTSCASPSDAPEDKATEIGQMAKIYENSYVAIMASRAKSVEEGFLHPRSHFGADRRSPGFRLQYEAKNGRRGSVVLVEESSSQTYADPLSLRA
ncbi:hypothetical protein H9Q69_009288 [Fusarium xylarioides]|nr:hypothetical protein H9Q69_009288 [Fusarium xylarioides]